MLIGLWLSRPRVHDRVAVVSVISSTITTPGGPGGPGRKKVMRHGLNHRFGQLNHQCFRNDTRGDQKQAVAVDSNLVHTAMSSPCVVAIGYTNGYNNASSKKDVQLHACGVTSLL